MKTYHVDVNDDLAPELDGWLGEGKNLWITTQDDRSSFVMGTAEPAEHFTADERKITMVALRSYRESLVKAKRDLINLTGGAPEAVEAIDEKIWLAESARQKVDHA